MSDKIKVSVVLPVYNVERYLQQCMDGILGQTLKEIEVICIDDGSADGSLGILREYERRDSRVQVLTGENHGAAAARNRGMERACGEYLIFLDSDDYIDKNYFQLLVAKARINDVVFIDVCQIDGKGKLLKEEKMSQYKTWTKDRLIRSQMTGKVQWGGGKKGS